MKFLQDYHGGVKINLDDLIEKEKNDPWVKAIFKRSRHNFLSISIVSQDYQELPKRTIRANGNIYHIFEPNSFRDVQSLYEDRASMDMSPKEFK